MEYALRNSLGGFLSLLNWVIFAMLATMFGSSLTGPLKTIWHFSEFYEAIATIFIFGLMRQALTWPGNQRIGQSLQVD